MLTLKLRTEIDKKWEACWPVSQVKPLAFFDLLSYLFFFKRIGESQTINRRNDKTSGTNFTYSLHQDELHWSSFKEMDVQHMYKLFTAEGGIISFLKSYGHSNFKYSHFVKEPLLITPSAILLANTVNIINSIEQEDVNIQGTIFEYLLSKVEIVAKNGQVYPPGYAVELLVSLVAPAKEDLIVDPVAGNGSLLVNSVNYIAANPPGTSKNYKRSNHRYNFKGIDFDPVQLRIAAMNMVLHGFEDPPLENVNIFNKVNINLPEPPTLTISNLVFKENEKRITVGPGNFKKEINSSYEMEFLNFIVNNLQNEGRAAVMIPANFLYDNRTEITKIRQRIIDDFTVEAVITLPVKPGSLFSGAGILIFSKRSLGKPGNTWFYKMKPTYSAGNAINSDHDEVLDVLRSFKKKDDEIASGRGGKSFHIPIDEIRNNNYNLNFNQYKSIEKVDQAAKDSNIPKKFSFIIPANDEGEPGDVKNRPAIDQGKRWILIVLLLALLILAAIAWYLKNRSNNGIPSTTGATTGYNNITQKEPVLFFS